MNQEELPTPWQRKALWSALTALAVVTIGTIAIGLVWLGFRVLAFLQPILVPFAMAGVIAYLLEPIVSKLVKWGSSRLLAVIFVFSVVTVGFAGLMLWLAPNMWTQSINLAHKVPRYTIFLQKRMTEISEDIRVRTGVTILPPPGAKTPDATPKPEPKVTVPDPDEENPATAPPEATFDLQQLFAGDWLQGMVQDAGKHLLALMRNSLGGFLGVVGFLISLVIVPIYLFYFLIEAPSIASQWHDYLPLRASAFKDEVVSVLNEINGYLIAFFRGQLVVSMINGAITGIGLAFVRLEFGLLIGVALCFLGIVPYLGIAACWLIAVILAVVQGGSWLVPAHPFWLFPLVVSCIFFVVHWFDNLFVTPRIIGESVGLHPFTVIFSVFVWSLLMGGLLGAILAVPLTATVKVLLRRYVWERSFRVAGGQVLPREASISLPANPAPAEPGVVTR
ncbi:MAG TPA: AI-2E family transporter [Chthoniobacteraceae bacterium]|jgi:predicted PurR-regulated permease PerM|nr:AI-2E family transporter [Chthoniobacteraceae bacterium]